MAPTKRASGATPSVDNKRRKLNEVAKAIMKVDTYSKAVLRMLEGAVSDSLGIAAEERHAYQQQLVTMVGEVLGSFEIGLQTQISTAEAKLTEANEKKSSLASAEGDAMTDYNAKVEAAKTAKTAFHKSETTVKEAKGALKTAESEQKEGDADLEEAGKTKATIEDARASCFEPLKAGIVEGTAKDKDNKIKTIKKLAEEFSLEATLLDSLPLALKRGPGERSTFETFTLGNMEDALNAHIAQLDQKLNSGEADKAARQGKVDAARAAVESAIAHSDSCKAASEAAHAAETDAHEVVKKAKKAAHDFVGEFNKAEKQSTELKDELQHFQATPLSAYKELVQLKMVPVPEAGTAALPGTESTTATAAS